MTPNWRGYSLVVGCRSCSRPECEGLRLLSASMYRFVSCLGPLIAGTLIAYFGGFGMAATIVGLFFILGVVAAPFLPETKGKPLPHALWLGEAT